MSRRFAIIILLLACLPMIRGGLPLGGTGEDMSWSDTNLLIAVGGVFALFWFVRELSESIPFAVLCASLFALWNAELGGLLAHLAYACAALTLLSGLWRHRAHVERYAPGALLSLYLAIEAPGVISLETSAHWGSPARAEALMTVFSLLGLATYARFIRLHAPRNKSEITPLDLPATRTSVQRPPSKPPSWIWPLLSLVFASLALATDSQALMLPAASAVVAAAFTFKGFKPSWLVPLTLGVVALAYFAVYRSGFEGEWRVVPMMAFLFPAASASVIKSLSTHGAFVLAWPVANVAAYLEARRQWALAFAGFSLSAVAALPCGFESTYNWDFFLPMAMRTIFVVTLGSIAGQLFVNAASPQALQAPKRLSPAPGSLPHP